MPPKKKNINLQKKIKKEQVGGLLDEKDTNNDKVRMKKEKKNSIIKKNIYSR
jgi:hypothetical protein